MVHMKLQQAYFTGALIQEGGGMGRVRVGERFRCDKGFIQL